MFAMVEACQESGLTKKAFCEEQGISPQVYYYWQGKYRSEKPETEHSFAPLKVSSAVAPAEKIEIRYPNGVSISLERQADPALIRTLIQLL